MKYITTELIDGTVIGIKLDNVMEDVNRVGDILSRLKFPPSAHEYVRNIINSAPKRIVTGVEYTDQNLLYFINTYMDLQDYFKDFTVLRKSNRIDLAGLVQVRFGVRKNEFGTGFSDNSKFCIEDIEE